MNAPIAAYGLLLATVFAGSCAGTPLERGRPVTQAASWRAGSERFDTSGSNPSRGDADAEPRAANVEPAREDRRYYTAPVPVIVKPIEQPAESGSGATDPVRDGHGGYEPVTWYTGPQESLGQEHWSEPAYLPRRHWRSGHRSSFPIHTALGAGIGAIIGHQSHHRDRGALIGGSLGLLLDLGRWCR